MPANAIAQCERTLRVHLHSSFSVHFCCDSVYGGKKCPKWLRLLYHEERRGTRNRTCKSGSSTHSVPYIVSPYHGKWTLITIMEVSMRHPPPVKRMTATTNKECFSALCCASVAHGFCCVWSGWMLIGLNSCVCLEALHSDCFYCMWYLLCLEILHSHCFCCMWYCYHAFSLDECPSSPAGGRIFCCPCILIC